MTNNDLFTAKQIEFMKMLQNPKKHNYHFGATGAGKTYFDLVYTMPTMLLRNKDKEGLNVILGVSEASVIRNILSPMKAYWGDKLVKDTVTQNKTVIFGQQVEVIGMEKANQIKKIRGSRIKFAYGDEVADWDYEAWNFLESRLTLSHSVFVGAFNPVNDSHFLRKFLFPRDEEPIYTNLQFLKYTIYDNTFMDEQTKADLIQRYKGTVWEERYIHGNFANAEGLIYEMPSRDDFYIDEIPNNIIEIVAGCDIGKSTSATTFVLIGITADKKVIILDEVKWKGEHYAHTAVELYKKHVGMWKLQYPQLTTVWIDSAEPAYIKSMDNALPNVTARGVSKKKISDRIIAVSSLLNLNKIKALKGKTLVYEALRSALWDEKNEGERLDNGTVDIDIIDAFEYSWMRMMNRLTRS